MLINDRFYKDAIETVVESQSKEIAKNLLLYFAQQKLREFFGLATYLCFDLLLPEDVQEIAWVYGMEPFTRPFLIQTERNRQSQMERLARKVEELEQSQTEKSKKPIDLSTIQMGLQGNQQMLMNGENPYQSLNKNFQSGFNPF